MFLDYALVQYMFSICSLKNKLRCIPRFYCFTGFAGFYSKTTLLFSCFKLFREVKVNIFHMLFVSGKIVSDNSLSK